jgi:hypothetical protein
MKFTTLKMKGASVEVFVSEDGRFTATVGGVSYSADSLADLKAKAAAGIRRSAKVEIRFYRAVDGKVRSGTITGIHASNRNVLVRFDGEKGVDQEYGWRTEGEYLELDAEELEEFRKLIAAEKAATDAVAAFEKAHAFKAIDRVEREIAAAEAGGAK